MEEVQKGGEWPTRVLILVIVRSESAPISVHRLIYKIIEIVHGVEW